ncbi:CRE_collapsed_G0053930.mRNA.1.CDS.1 [Saccharomyces cerevisiae]|nr:Fit3p [Saccharomyces cerevisiae YJM326]AJT76678.1 Fit3p [Saccharomyces cerevisiae YJM451]AJT81093.1 Fit3p [Saccharomyces cerevisiae YJM682]AJT81587.1 Fit3p [Saccharomyces cerevisiae YJM683]AJT93749.1 Fit3p [Saccharomyces cerevisiae YJM1304]KZV08277.1 FIT3 [Saccharomyces cerevisiae]
MKFSSALVLSAVAATALAESITTTITATKNGHVYTKTVTQDATFVWGGEDSYASSTSAAESSAAETSAAETSAAATTSSAAETSSADEGSGSSITTTITATKNGHVYTKTVTQDATFVWTGEGSSNTWSPSSTSTSSEAATSSASTTATTTAETSSSSATSSSTAELSSYTGAADAITAGTGLMGAALAAVMLL